MNENQILLQVAQEVYVFCGINYQHNIASLELKVRRRLKALHIESINEYLHFLKTHVEEMTALIEEVTINETYFFREDKQLTFYKQHVLPSLKSTNRPINIWSAACSSGEEPYTLAMLTAETAMFNARELQIVGSDINQTVLNYAKAASYPRSSLSFRRIESYWLNKYFEEQEMNYSLKQSIKDYVSFSAINLTNASMFASHPTYDVIFCRNVLIYFDEETKKQVISSFYKQLQKGGYLFLGHAEMIPSMKEIGFELLNDNGAFYYRKE